MSNARILTCDEIIRFLPIYIEYWVEVIWRVNNVGQGHMEVKILGQGHLDIKIIV